ERRDARRRHRDVAGGTASLSTRAPRDSARHAPLARGPSGAPTLVRRLRPVSARRGFRITLAALLLPAIGIVVLAQVESVRRPLDEPEAILAVAVPAPGDRLQRTPRTPATEAAPSRSAVALTSIGPTLLGNGELP